ncbi:MAG TPA: hypothetical protein VGM47_03600 [Gammaproteobacteria bacterium]|jgi:hypothetical protein
MEYPFTLVDLHLSDAHLKAIGKLTIYLNEIESCLQALIHNMLNLEGDIGPAVTAELGARDLDFILQSVSNEKYPDSEFDSRLKTVLGAISQLRGERNTLVHATWAPTHWHGWSERIN